jgi:cell wall-associated NlpC family hydrolase
MLRQAHQEKILVLRRSRDKHEKRAERLGSEAIERQKFIAEAATWLGTPFRDQADVKGGGVDCAMLLVRAAADTGLITIPGENPRWPRPYAPQWHLHRSEEKFLAIVSQLGAEVRREPIPGDVVVYQVGRCFSHGGIILRQVDGKDDSNNGELGTHVIHAYYKTQNVTISPLHDSELSFLPDGRRRPFKLFDLWKK